MGFYDREYVRRDNPGLFRSFGSSGQVCKWLIGVNVVVFLLQILMNGAGGGSNLTEGLQLDPGQVEHGQVWRLLTYAFVHEPRSLLHILFNMLFLWWFGNEVEDLYGPKEFLTFYLTAAVLGGLAYFGWQFSRGTDIPCLGASGAVTAVMVLFAFHYPRRQILLMFIFPIPIWVFVAFQVAQDAFIFASGEKSGTAVVVHLAGAAFGFIYYKSQFRLLSLWDSLRSWQKQRTRPRLRVYREERPAPPVAVASTPASDIDEHLEAKLDAVLEKVARLGQASLTENERQLLLRASEVYRRKRT